MIIKIEPDEAFMKELKEINQSLSEMKSLLVKENPEWNCLYCAVKGDYDSFVHRRKMKHEEELPDIVEILQCKACKMNMFLSQRDNQFKTLPYDYFSQENDSFNRMISQFVIKEGKKIE